MNKREKTRRIKVSGALECKLPPLLEREEERLKKEKNEKNGSERKVV